MGKILVTTANGMFGKAVAAALVEKGYPVRLMVRDIAKCTISGENAEIVRADMDKPESLIPVMEGIDSVFLSSPIDSRIAEREIAVIKAAKAAGVKRIVKIYGAVKHEDALSETHHAVMDYLYDSGLEWALVSPNSVMETSLYGFQPSIKYMNAIYGISGESRVGLVALKDVAEVSAVVLTSGGHHAKNYELTGAESLNLFDVAFVFSNVLNKRIDYIDLSEDTFSRMIRKNDKTITAERLELEILCHLRAWKNGKADLVTDTVRTLTGRDPVSLEQFVSDNFYYYRTGIVNRLLALLMRKIS